ncbi:MAG: acyl-CoA dehydrogenase family protein [Deltaproteobacteria bacterium]|nr:acyl-CoA dehydrogenase family protein [Deltaproteobacteria bacterium]MBW2006912.1 acyl-CoA dehydrogenase family protein [Deltaproteobacteria bacterium]
MITFTDEQIMVRDMIRKLCREKIADRSREVDETKEYPWDLHQLFVDYGLFNLRVPERYGGAEMDYTSACIVVEEIARVDGACANTIAHHQAGMCAFMGGANEMQRDKYLPRVGRGDYLVGFALTEPNAGSDAFSLTTRARQDGDGFVIDGTKCFISNSGLTDLYVLFTTVNPAMRRDGVTAFLVDKDTPGLSIGKNENKMGLRASPTRQLVFENMRIPAENLLGQVCKGWELVLRSLTETRVLVGAMALGIAQGAMDAAVAYAREREQFGKPIAEFQGVSFMLADMAIKVECARALIYQIASSVDKGMRDQHYYASVAKCFASDMAMKVTTDAVQVMGGYGYTKEYPVEKMMRDAKATQIIEGTNQIQRIQIARNLLKRYG